jgi:capsular exopolysaccharide synthesis family protein
VVERLVDDLDLHVTVKIGERDKKRPSEVFSSFDASPDARAGVYHFQPADSGRFAVSEWDSDSLITTVGSDFSFLGQTGHISDNLSEAGIKVGVTQFSREVKRTQDRIEAKRLGRDADLVEVTCEGSTAEQAHALCQGVLASYMRLRTDLQRAEATATATFLRAQAARLGEQLAAAEDSLELYAQENRIVALEERANAEVRQFTELKAQRDQLESERVALAGLIRDIEGGEGGSRKYRDLASFPTFLQNPAVTELLTSLLELENRRSDLATRRSGENADVVALDTRIGDIERQIRSIAVSYEQALGTQIGSLDATLESTTQRLAIIPAQQVGVARLERRASLLEDLYRMLETRLKEAEVAEAVELPSVRVVDAASMPFRPVLPNVPLNLVLGSLLGLACGLGVGLFREHQDTRVRARSEVERQTGLPVLAIVPRLRNPGSVMPLPTLIRPGVTRTLQARRGTARSMAKGRWRRKWRQKDGKHRVFRPAGDKQIALECFRSLAADLRFAGQSRGNGGFQSIAITSAGRDEGKTLTACNLALVRAAHGARTLLIDADMRGGGVARFFDFPPSAPGLSDVLAGSADVEGVWKGVVAESELWVMSAGTPTPHSARLLESAPFARVLERAARQFDLVIIDTPPLNVITDAATVAAIVDAVVVVVREGVTERDALETTLERLERASGNVVGVVLNDVSLPRQYVSEYEYRGYAKGRG